MSVSDLLPLIAMKNILLAVLVLFASIAYAQTDCKPYIPVSEGTTWEMTSYSAKGKVSGKTSYELVKKVESGNGTTFTIASTSYDNKGKESFSSEFDAFCIDGKFKFDMAFKMDGATMASYENMDIDVDATEFEIPPMEAAAGTELKDGSLTVNVGSGGMSMFKMVVNVTDRKVEGRESMKTTAGTFDCIRISQRSSTKMMVKIEASSKEWYAEEVGMVRSESYNKKDKLTGYSELTKLDRK